MYLRLRQICLAARALTPVVADIEAVLGLRVCYHDPGVAHFGLENALFPIGSNFLEIVAPIQDNTAVHRHLERHGGDCGYMVIAQTDDQAHFRRRAANAGVRTAFDYSTRDLSYHCWQLHPKDMRAAFLEIDQQTDNAPDGPWHPAGPDDWREFRSDAVTDISAVELQSHDPQQLCRRWDAVIGLGYARNNSGEPQISLENAALRFVRDTDGRGELLSTVEVLVPDRSRMLEAADTRGLTVGDHGIVICGTQFRLREEAPVG